MGLIGHTTSGLISLHAEEAIAPGLRVKWGVTPGIIAIAGDEPCIGIAVNRSLNAGEPITVLDIKSLGTMPFTAGGAVAAAGAGFTSAAGGKVVTGAGGAEDYGVAITAATADGGQFEGTSGK